MNSRKPDVVDAIRALHPTAQFTTNNGKIDGWHSSDITQPTEDAINAKLTELNNEFPMKLLREERDRLIVQSDWRVIKAKETGTNIPTAWKTYRQALRDLPANNTPTLDSTGKRLNMTSVNWPTEPS